MMDRMFVLCSFAYAVAGMLLGIHMAASQNHSEKVTHAHMMLAGFVVSFIYGLCHKLWLSAAPKTLATVQFYVHNLGVVVMSVGLFLLYGGLINPATIDPILAMSSFAVLAGMVLMVVLFVRHPKTAG